MLPINTQETNKNSPSKWKGINNFVVFSIEEHCFALPYTNVKRIIQAVAVTPIPNSPPEIMGVINVEGEITTVLNFKKILGFQRMDKLSTLRLEEILIIVDQNRSLFAFAVDNVDFKEYSEDWIVPIDTSTDNNFIFVDKLIKTPEGLVQWLNLEKICKYHADRLNKTEENNGYNL